MMINSGELRNEPLGIPSIDLLQGSQEPLEGFSSPRRSVEVTWNPMDGLELSPEAATEIRLSLILQIRDLSL